MAEKLCSEDVFQLYKDFSGGAHGGFLGLRLVKDNPDDVHINPRADKRSQELALIASIRLTLEIVRGCDRFEAASADEKLSQSLFEKFRSMRRRGCP